jgi:two-component sensor histidine kinase
MIALNPAVFAGAGFATLPGVLSADGSDDGEIGYRQLFDAIDQGFCIIEMLFDADDRPRDYRFVEVNAAFAAHTGLRDAVGKTILTLCPGHEQHWFDIYGRVALLGEPIRFEREAAALGRWYSVYAFRVGAPEQRRLAVLFSDITAQHRIEERARLLAAEVDHRARNMLTVVASLVRLTRAGTVDDFRNDLLGRIRALANSRRILSEDSAGAALAQLVADEMAPYRAGGRVTWDGPAVVLDSDTVTAVAMALHELATNALKYGALSRPDGRIAIDWSLRADGALVLCWRESGGPPVAPPTRQGMGTMVVTMGIRDQLGGDVRFDWRREGLVCELIVPLRG